MTEEHSLLTGSVPKKLAVFAFPLLLANILQSFYNVVDMLVIGQIVGDTGLAAIGNASKLYYIITSICIGMTMGGAVLIAQYKGADDKKGQAESFQMLALLSLVSSLLVTIVSLVTYQPLFKMLNVPADAYQDACDYMKIICCGTVFVFGYNAVCSVLKGLGDSKSPLYFVGIATVINIVLDIILVGPLGMGTAGAAYATITAQGIALFLSGMNKRGITYYLNDHGTLCPTAYKQQQGLKYNAPNAQGNPMWSTITIDTILKNRVYVGDMVQGRQRVKSYKIHIQEKVPEEEWFIVENTHEAIIDRETFAKVQSLLKRDTRTAPKAKQLYLFSGFLKCADCGRAMSRIASKGIYVYYQCGTYKSLSKKACTMHSIKSDRLEAGVLFAIQQQVHLALTYSEFVARINSAPLKRSKSKRLEDTIAAKEKELAKIMRYKQALYQDWKDGEITRNDYRHMSEDYEQQIEALTRIMQTLTAEQEQLENGVDAESPCLTTFLKYRNIDKLTREILGELIDHIKVYEGGNISVKFKYADEFRRITEYIELNSPMVTGAAG